MKTYLLPVLIASLLPLNVCAEPTATTETTRVINCDSHFPQETQSIDSTTIEAWAHQAAIQSFTLDHATLDNQLSQLKACYTDQGWQGFNDAMTKSGNMQAIKANQLTVTSETQNPASVAVIKENEWKVSLPLKVTYANKDQKIAQLLTIDLIINRKSSGDLGIVQLIATPTKTDDAIK
jgi:hypothetical protein